MKKLLLDAFCGAGGATKGYQRAGFYVVGVDINPQPNYCGDEFHQDDAVNFIKNHGHEFNAIHTSPPCQAYTNCQKIRQRKHPDLVAITREVLMNTNLPWVIENVEGAPLHNPVILCGTSFPELQVYRHRLFESSFYIQEPRHASHTAPLRKMGRPPRVGEFMHVVGNFSGVTQARKAMGIDWMTRDELREAIPPIYAAYVGLYLMAHLHKRGERG